MKWIQKNNYRIYTSKDELRNIMSQLVIFQLFDVLVTSFPRPIFLNEKKIAETLQFLKNDNYQIILIANSYDFKLIEESRKLISKTLGWSPIFITSPKMDEKLFNFIDDTFFIKIRNSFICTQTKNAEHSRYQIFGIKNDNIIQRYNLTYLNPLELFPHRKVSPKPYQELVIFVGMPGSGKSYTAGKILKNNPNYVACDQDAMPRYTIEETLACTEKQLKTDKSVLVVTVNATRERRAKFIDFANKLNIPFRILWFIRNGRYTNLQRGKVKQDEDITFVHKKPVPDAVFKRYYENFQEPDNLEAPVEIIY